MSHGIQDAVAPLEEAIDHVSDGSTGRLILEYGDYECPTPAARFARSSASRSG
jgi:hypothetical protein